MFQRLRRAIRVFQNRHHDWSKWNIAERSQYGMAAAFSGGKLVVQQRRCARCGFYQEVPLSFVEQKDVWCDTQFEKEFAPESEGME